MGKFRKQIASLLVFLLIASNFSFVAGVSAQGNTNLETVRGLLQEEQEVISVDGMTEAPFASTDIVRVIVELKGETPIEVATKKDVLFKELSAAEKQSLTEKVLKEQTTVKSAIAQQGVNFDYKYNFTTSFNGFSGDVLFGDIEKIENLSSVSRVYLANEYNRPETEPNMDQSHTFIQSIQTWADAKFQGEGMVVAVLDTGVDPDHQDFNITDGVDVALTEDGVNGILSANNIKGKYFNAKVPFGYNYFDLNNEILDLGPHASHHGMHVAGTVVANGQIMGVAPEAQVLGMKVFSNDPNYPSTTSDVYLAAIDDSIKLGADVLNMSLGAVASFYDPLSAEDVAITRAVDNGVVVAVSAGNSGHIGRSYANPLFKNPDIGVVGAPGLNYDTIQVAAAGNVAFQYQNEFTVAGIADFSAVGYGMDSWTALDGLELVDLGNKLGGSLADYEGIDVAGKVVVLPRGGFPFIEKNEVAMAAGAAGIIVRNHDPAAFFFDNQGGWRLVPFAKIQFAEGIALQKAIADAIANGQTPTLKVEELVAAEGSEMGRMTEFSSWGSTPSLELKPEITAPGGGIYSTEQWDTYGVKSGTSMSAPHVAGGAALVQQYLKSDDRFLDLTASERTRLAKALLMNTAYIIDGLNGQPFSPRHQGAGMMQTYNAVTTPIYVTYKETNEAKVELYDFTETTVSFTLVANNLVNEEVTYSVDTTVLTDMFREVANGPKRNALISGDLVGAVVNAPSTVTVPAGSSVEFTVEIDFTEAKIAGYAPDGTAKTIDLVEDIFIEGFVTLSAVQLPEISVPFLGFFGQWDRPSFLDGLSVLGQDRYYFAHRHATLGERDVVNERGQFLTPPITDADGNKFYAINPKGTKSVVPAENELRTGINPIPAFLRNTREVHYNVLDENGKLVRRIFTQHNVRKNFGANQFSFVSARAWDGKIRNNVVDGKFYYEIKGKVDAPGAEFQSIKIPVLVDTTAPEVTIDYYNNETKTLHFSATDAGIGVDQIFVFVGQGEAPVAVLPAGTTSFTFEEDLGLVDVEVYATDKLRNIGFAETTVNDVVEPLIFLYNHIIPAFGAYNSNDVRVAGYVTDNATVTDLTINGEEVDITFQQVNVMDGSSIVGTTMGYYFDTVLTFENDGIHEITAVATDKAGNEFGITRRVYVDTTPGTITVTAPETVAYDVEEVEVSFLLEDNFHYLSFYIDDNHEFLLPSTNVAGGLLNGASETFTTTLEVQPGENTFALSLGDYAGNVTNKELKITRATEAGPAPVVPGPAPVVPGPAPVVPGPTPEPPVDPKDKELPLVTFGDIKTHWAKAEIEFLASRSIIKGVSENSFAPNADITRAEFAALVTRVLELEKGEFQGSFTDVNANAWYALEVEAAQKAGIVLGSAGKFDANSKITREEMAVMIVRAYEFYAKETVALDGSLQFADSDSVALWAKDAVQAATKLGIVNGKNSTTFAPKDVATRAEAATMLYRLINKF